LGKMVNFEIRYVCSSLIWCHTCPRARMAALNAIA
jgi:hypothetical protein